MSKSPASRRPHIRPWMARVVATVATAAVLASGMTVPAQAAVDPESLTLEQLREPLPVADLLDVEFADGTAVDRSPRARALAAGAAATVADDEEVGSQVAVGTAGEPSAWQTPLWSDADYAALADDFAVEATFRIDTPIVGSDAVAVVSGQEEGGIGLDAHADDDAGYTLQLGTAGGPAAELEYGRWYHVVGFFDGSQSGLYVDGALAAAVDTTSFDVTPSAAGARSLVIGGDVTVDGAVGSTFGGRLKSTAIYSRSISELEAYRLSRLGLTSLDTVAPLVEVDGDVPATAKLEELLTVPGAEALDDTGIAAEVVVTVGGPDDIESAITPNGDGTYSFIPSLDGTYTLSYSAVDEAGHIAREPFTITVGDGSTPPDADAEAEAQADADAAAAAEAGSLAADPQTAADGDADVTFAAIGDIHDSWSELGEAYDFWDAQGVDATLFVGDLTNNATASEFQGLKDTIDSKAGYGIQLVAALGNHDVSSLGSYDLFTNSTGGQAPNADYVINGYHFITVSPGAGTLDTATGRPSVANSGNYAYAAAWVQQRLALATAEDPTKPVFVLVHHPLKCTHYVSNEWYGSGLTNGQCGSQLTSVFDGFPQAVVWGGHIHTPQNISSSVWQGQEGRSGTAATQGFTTVNAPPLAYFEFESGVVNTSPTSRGNDSTPDDAGNSRQTAIVEVRGSEVTIKNYDLLADQWIDQTWTWDVADAIDTSLSYDERFPLNNAHRASQTSAPVWPAGSAVAVTGIASDKAMVTFPQAVPAPNAVQDIVHKYRYTTVDVATGATVNTFLQWSGFYNLPLPASRNHEVWGLTAGREYEVRVTPVNTWGKEGAALTARLTAGEGGTTPGQPFDPTALTFEQLAEPIPSADLLDIDFGGGTVADLSPRAHAVIQGTAPIAVDPVLGKEAATYTADSAQGSRIAWSDADYALTQDGFAIEALAKVPAITTERDMISNTQTSGQGLEMLPGSVAGKVTPELWVRLGGSYVVARATNALTAGEWAHVVGQYDGAALKIYVNGALKAQVAASGNVQNPSGAARSWVVGGDISSTGGVEYPFQGSIGLARIYGAPLSEKDIYRLSIRELTANDTVAPMVRVVPPPPSKGTVNAVYTAPAAQAVDNSGRVTVTAAVTGPDGASLAVTPVEGGRFAFTPVATGDHTLIYTATDSAFKQAEASFTVSAVAEGTSLTPDPVVAYTFDGETGSTIADRTGNGVAATWRAGVEYLPGIHGTAAHVNGQNSFRFPGVAVLTDATGDFSVEFWINQTSFTGDAWIFSNRPDGSCGDGFSLFNATGSDGVLTSCWGTSGAKQYADPWGTNGINGTWHHIGAVVDRSAQQIRYFVDGTLTGTSSAGSVTAGSVFSSSSPWWFGYNGSYSPTIDALVDDFAFYDVALTAGEMSDRFGAGLGPVQHAVTIGDAPHGTAAADVASAVEGATVTLTATPDAGYELTGWQTTPEGVEIGQDGTFTMPAAAVAATPEFTPIAYAIAFDLGGGSADNPTTYTVESDAFTLAAPTLPGNAFEGWTGTGLDRPTTEVTIPSGSLGDRAYTATWRPVAADQTAPTVTVKTESKGKDGVYSTVSFKLYDAGKIDRVELNGVLKDLVDNAYSDLNGVKPGVFGAVAGKNTLEVSDVAGNVTTVTFTLDTTAPTVIAKDEPLAGIGGYEAVSFKLFDANNVDRVVLNGTVNDLQDAPWSDLNGVKPGVFGAVAGENTLVLHDIAGNSTTVTFTLRQRHAVTATSAGHGTASADVASALTGTTVTLTAAPDTGYHLSGWTTTPANLAVAADGTYTQPDDSVTATALFAANAYTVAFDANGGSGAQPAATAVYDEELVLPAVTFTHETDVFAGWSLTPGGPAVFADGATVSNLTAEQDAAVTLYAIWKPAPPAAWRASVVYLGGEYVLYRDRVYQAQWWTQGVAPDSVRNGAWAEVGAEVSTPQGVVRAWTASWTYLGGEIVAHGGHLFQASWWTRGDQPGSGRKSPWRDLGAY